MKVKGTASFRITDKLKKDAEKKAESMEMCFGEYIRYLIRQDLK